VTGEVFEKIPFCAEVQEGEEKREVRFEEVMAGCVGGEVVEGVPFGAS